MLGQNFSAEAYSLFRTNTSVSPNFQRELVIVGYLAYTRIFHSVVYAADRGEDGIDRDDADRLVIAFIPICLDVAATAIGKIRM